MTVKKYLGIPNSVFKYNPNDKQNVTFEKAITNHLTKFPFYKAIYKTKEICYLFEYTSITPSSEGMKKGEWFCLATNQANVALNAILNAITPASMPLEELKVKIKDLILKHYSAI